MVKKLSNQTERKVGVFGGIDLHHKLLTQGKRALTEVELLSLVLNRRGNCEISVEKVDKIFQLCQNQLHELSNWTLDDLRTIEELDDESSVVLLAAWELSNRRWKWLDQFPVITQSKDAFGMFAPELAQLNHEEFHVAFLNRANKVVSRQCMSSGGVNATIVDMRMILQKAIMNKASAIIVAHNHPSGHVAASKEDKELTKKLKEACGFFDIQLLDHLILSGKNYFSFADSGLI